MFPHVRRDGPGSQRNAEYVVPFTDIAISEPPSEIAAGEPKCPRAIYKKPGDRIPVFPEAQLKRRIHTPLHPAQVPGKGRVDFTTVADPAL